MKKEFYLETINNYTTHALDSIDVLTGFSTSSIRSTVDDTIGRIRATVHIAGYDPELKWADYLEIERFGEKEMKLVKYEAEVKLS